MNIAIVTNNYLPNPYGVTGSIESYRAELEQRGHMVHIFAPRWKEYVDVNPNVHRFPSVDFSYKIQFPVSIPFSLKMNACFRSVRFDIIHSQHPNFLGSVAMRWAKKRKIPIVFTWHTRYDLYGHFGPPILGEWYARSLTRKSVRYANRSDAVIVPSRSMEKYILSRGVNGKKVVVLPSGINEDEFVVRDKKVIRKKFGIEDDALVLVTLSRMTSEKNVLFLAKSIFKVLEKNKNTVFLVIGSGGLEKVIQERARKSGLEKRVFFVGEVSWEDRGKYLAAGDVFVYASTSETQGLAVAEAMYLGLPVVAVRSFGIEDALMDKVSGFLVGENMDEFVDGVERLLLDKDRRLEFGARGAELARVSFVSKVCTDRLLEVYQGLIAIKR